MVTLFTINMLIVLIHNIKICVINNDIKTIVWLCLIFTIILKRQDYFHTAFVHKVSNVKFHLNNLYVCQ